MLSARSRLLRACAVAALIAVAAASCSSSDDDPASASDETELAAEQKAVDAELRALHAIIAKLASP